MPSSSARLHDVVVGAVELDEVRDLRGVAAGGLHGPQEVALGDDHAAAGVAELVGGLLGRAGAVDRERHRAEVQHGGVDEVELGPVEQHQPDRVAALDAERGEPAGDRLHALRRTRAT